MNRALGRVVGDGFWNIFKDSYITSIWGRDELACVYVWGDRL